MREISKEMNWEKIEKEFDEKFSVRMETEGGYCGRSMLKSDIKSFLRSAIKEGILEFDSKIIRKCKGDVDDDGCHIDYLEVDEDQRAKAIEELEGK